MKMVAAAKLRKAQEQAISSRPYCSSMEKIVSSLASKLIDNAPELEAFIAGIKRDLGPISRHIKGSILSFSGIHKRAFPWYP